MAAVKATEAHVKKLLWIDSGAAIAVGIGVLLLSTPLGELEGLPRGVLVFTGVANLLYGSFSLSIAVRIQRPMRLIKTLVAGNLAWVPVCFGLAVAFHEQATIWGFGHLVGEGVFVGVLAFLEWSNRDLLLTAN